MSKSKTSYCSIFYLFWLTVVGYYGRECVYVLVFFCVVVVVIRRFRPLFTLIWFDVRFFLPSKSDLFDPHVVQREIPLGSSFSMEFRCNASSGLLLFVYYFGFRVSHWMRKLLFLWFCFVPFIWPVLCACKIILHDTNGGGKKEPETNTARGPIICLFRFEL